jgi:hypothetical protein
MTCGPRPPCQRLGRLGARCASDGIPWGASGGVFLEKGFSPRAAVTLSHSLLLLRPFASEPSAPLCIRAPLPSTATVAMASLVHPERFQNEGALNLVRNLLGWSASAFAGRIHAGATPLGDLAAGEFVLFVSYLSCGLALPISPFFLLLLEELGLQLQHLTPTPSFRRPSSPTCARCSWGWRPVPPSSAISSCGPRRPRTTSARTTSRRGRTRPAPTSPPLAARGGKTGTPTGWSSASRPTTASRCRATGQSLTGSNGGPSRR